MSLNEQDVIDFKRRGRGRPPSISPERWARIEKAVLVDEEKVSAVARREELNPATIHRHMAELRKTQAKRGS